MISENLTAIPILWNMDGSVTCLLSLGLKIISKEAECGKNKLWYFSNDKNLSRKVKIIRKSASEARKSQITLIPFIEKNDQNLSKIFLFLKCGQGISNLRSDLASQSLLKNFDDNFFKKRPTKCQCWFTQQFKALQSLYFMLLIDSQTSQFCWMFLRQWICRHSRQNRLRQLSCLWRIR